ncbi:hypothetical protein ACVDFE_00410 [Lentzea chajnantorensis]
MLAEQWADRLNKAADRLPDGDVLFSTARERVRHAAAIVAGALETDPTLGEDYEHGGRDLYLLAEMLRQLHPLAKQAAKAIEHERLVQGGGVPPADVTRARRLINPLAPQEFDALSEHLLVDVAQRIADAAQPDWRTPTRILERSERRLPSPDVFAGLADQMLAAVKPALGLEFVAPAAVRIAGLAEQLRAETERSANQCAAPGCEQMLQPAATGRPRRYCGATCRQRAHRAARAL